MGREREAIFKAFDNVFSTLKWETTEQGTRLYQPPIVDEVNIKNDVPILDLSNIQRKIKTKKDLKAFIQQLIDEATAKNSSASAETRDAHKVQLTDKVKTKNHGTYKVAQHIAYSSNKMQPKQREFIVSNIYDLIEYSFFVDETPEKKDKIGYDKVYRYYVPVRLNSNTVYTVRIVALHNDNNIRYESDIYDVIIDKKDGSRLQGRVNTPGLPAAGAAGTATDTISIADLLRNVKDSDGFPYIQNDDEIRIDGKYVHMKNSEGNYIASTVKDLRNFYKWFGNSKVVDNDGRPLVMYHGTPNKGFEEFNTPSHFSPDKKYAEGYQAPNASAMGFKQNSDNPGTYSVYLSIKHPFDARNDEAREIFLNEYRAYYSPELTDRGMVDWMEAEDLIEWLKENHPEYDGLIVDEGGTGGYGEAVKSRGDSYLPFEPAQIKSVENTGEFDPKNPNIYYQPTETQKGIAESGEYRGKTDWFRDSARTIITLFRSADASTLPHELAHVFMLDLQRMATLNPDGRLGQILKDLKETVGEPQGEIAGEYSVEQQEKFARLFERYLAEGYAPDKSWRRLFSIFKDWLRSIYRTFKDFPELSPAAKDLFDRWLSFDDVSNIPGMETLKEYRGRINALKAVAEAAKENRDTETDGITVQDVKAVLNITRMERPEEPEAVKAYNETLAIVDSITENQAEAENILDRIEDMEHRGARQFDSRDVAMFDRAIEQIEAIQAGKDTESGGTSFYQGRKEENQVLDYFDKSAPDDAFVKSRWGNIAHGIISEEIANKAGIQPGEIRVYNSLKEHIERVKTGESISRIEQIRSLGYDNPIDFIDDVMENLALIQTGSNGSILLTGKIGINNTVVVKLETANGFYKVTTIMARRRIKQKNTVWEAALPLRDKTRTTGEIDSEKESVGPNGTISIADKKQKSNTEDNSGQTLYQSANSGEYDRNDYTYGFRPEKDPEAAIRKINAVIEDLIKEVEKRKGGGRH